MSQKILLVVLLITAGIAVYTIYFKDSFVNPTDCPVGSWCPSGSVAGNNFLCPAGTYGSSTGLSTPGCSGFCRVGCVCHEGSTNDCPQQCPAGFYCVQGTGGIITPIMCPEGHYCPTGTSVPNVCQPGKYCPAGSS